MKKFKKVILVPGHGGTDPGAIFGGRHERELTHYLVDELEKKVIADGLTDRVEILGRNLKAADEIAELIQYYEDNDLKAKEVILYSIHFNAAGLQQATGVEVFYRYNHMKPIAELLSGDIAEWMALRNRGGKHDGQSAVKKIGVLGTPFTHALLIEWCFLTNLRLDMVQWQNHHQGALTSFYKKWIYDVLSD